MRIIHLSDLHVNKKRFTNDNRLPIPELIADLQEWNKRKKIDFIVITGDIVDQGGISFKKTENYYSLIEKKVIEEIYKSVGLDRHHVYIIPGNHDVNRGKIDPHTYKGMIDDLKKPGVINEYISKHVKRLNPNMKGGDSYNKYERERYKGSKNSAIGNFQSAFIYTYNGINIGIAAFNSSWSCFKESDEAKILFGTQQILHASDFFKNSQDGTAFNIGLIHHPLDFLQKEEADEAEALLKKEGFDMVLSGHTHRDYASKNTRKGGDLIFSVARSAFGNNREEIDEFKSGYKILDFVFSKENYIDVLVNYRKYVKHRHFDIDTENGEKEGAESFHLLVTDKNRKFYEYLKSKSTEASAERKEIFESLSNTTKGLLESSFPTISDKILEKINSNILTFNEFNHYRHNTTVEYEIRDLKGKYFEILETQTFSIITTGKGFDFKISGYVEIENDKDNSDLRIHSLVIDKKEFSKSIKYVTKTKPIKDSKGRDSEIITKTVRFNRQLPGQPSYNVKRVQTSVHSLIRNGIWKVDVGEVMDGIHVILRNSSNLKVDVVGFGNNSTFVQAISDIRSIQKNSTDDLDYKGVLMPGDGYTIIINPK